MIILAALCFGVAVLMHPFGLGRRQGRRGPVRASRAAVPGAVRVQLGMGACGQAGAAAVNPYLGAPVLVNVGAAHNDGFAGRARP